MSEWFEKNEFWEMMFPYMFPEERFKIADEEIEKVFTLTGFKGGTVFDLCCGPGRHSIVMAKKGAPVTGVDRTEFLLDKAKAMAMANNLEIEFVLEDMRSFIRPDSFDLVINMFTSFGYFDNKEDDLRVFRNVHDSLREGGVFLVDVIGKEQIAKVFLPTTSETFSDGTMLIQRHEIFDDWTRIRNEWILIKKDRAKSFIFHHTLYSGQELKDRLLSTGFRKVKLFGSLDGDEYGPDAKRLIALGWK